MGAYRRFWNGWYGRKANKLILDGQFHRALGYVQKISEPSQQREVIAEGLRSYSIHEVITSNKLTWAVSDEGRMKLVDKDDEQVATEELSDLLENAVAPDNPLLLYYRKIANGQ